MDNGWLANQQMDFDIYRSLVLAQYIKYWGVPLTRRIISKDNHPLYRVEVYFFSTPTDSEICRFATVGTGVQVHKGTEISADWEFMMVLPKNLGTATENIVESYILDVMAYSLRSDVCMEKHFMISPSPLAPKCWTTNALLVDEPRGEPEELSTLDVATRKISLYWLIPLTESEYMFAKTNGLKALFDKEDHSDMDIIDVNREGLV